MGYSPEEAEEPKASLRLWFSFPPAVLKRGTQPPSDRLYSNTQDRWHLYSLPPFAVAGAEAWHLHGRLGHPLAPALSHPPRDGQSAVPPLSIQPPQGASVSGVRRQKTSPAVGAASRDGGEHRALAGSLCWSGGISAALGHQGAEDSPSQLGCIFFLDAPNGKY